MTKPRKATASRSAQPPRAYLTGEVRAAFDAWLAATVARFVPPLRFREVRKGVRALSSLYVEQRLGADLAARAREGAGKRAALATYYAPLHFLTVHHALAALGRERLGAVRRVYDLGCGTGAAGAAVARGFETPPAVVAIDRAGFALKEARHTLAAFALPSHTRRRTLPQAMPRAGPGELLLLAWSVNELDEGSRAAVLAALLATLRGGAGLLVFEPLARRASPWWPTWAAQLRMLGVEERTVRVRLALPEWISRLDRASGLDHRELGARLLAGPGGCTRERTTAAAQEDH